MDSFSPPQAVQANARKGLQLRKQVGSGGTQSDFAMAKKLVAGEELTQGEVRSNAIYFKRHVDDAVKTKGWADPNNPSPAWIVWLMRGGNEGQEWVYGTKAAANLTSTDLKTYTPPPEVQASAKKGLELASKTGLVSSPHIRSVGQALAGGEPHTKERIRHIGAFLKAHSQDASVPNWGNEDNPSPAWIGWLMYGGEAGRDWANKNVGKMDMVREPIDLSSLPQAYVTAEKALSGAEWLNAVALRENGYLSADLVRASLELQEE